MDNTHITFACANCGKEHLVELLQYLPEADAYKRSFALAVRDNLELPTPPDEAALKLKYGFGSEDLFCPSCLDVLGELLGHK